MMKVAFVLVLFIVVLFDKIEANEKKKHLIILSGQSNMVRLDVDKYFKPKIVAEFGKDKVIIVKSAKGGKPIRDWYKKWKPAKGDNPKATGVEYDRLMKRVKVKIEGQEIDSVTFIWMQGERDAKESHGDVYEESLKGLFVQISDDLDRKDIKFIVGRINDFDMKNKKYPHWVKVRQAIEKVAKENKSAEWIDTDDLNDKGKINDLHCTKKGYEALGERFSKKTIELIKSKNAKKK